MKQKIAFCLALLILFGSFGFLFVQPASATEYAEEPDCKSAILMEASTGTVLYEKNADEALPPASVTKIMSLLLIMESIDSGKIQLTDMVTASERAAEMGGSQIFLKVGEEMSVEDLLKSIVMASANDATVALAEYIAGSEAGFVRMMNEKAAALGMKNTTFENTNGLDDTAVNHVTSARDIALMSQELLSHPKILDYTTLWMDSIRDGAFTLTNTNRLVRYYSGANGLKTGSTAKAGFCISATACRDGMQLIAVVMGAPSRDTRNDIARSLLDFGFSGYALYTHAGGDAGEIKVTGGVSDKVALKTNAFSVLVKKEELSKIESQLSLPESVAAPIKKGAVVGEMRFLLNGKEIGKTAVYAEDEVAGISYFSYFLRLLREFVSVSLMRD